jgi:glutathione S-transferase
VKLFYSATSPYVRKVMACAISREVDAQIELVPTNPHVSPPALVAAIPLSKVPCLVTDDGLSLFDSPVICEYLDRVEDGTLPMFPPIGPARWRALKFQAMGDGILDDAVGRRTEQGKPSEAARDAWMARQQAAVDRTLLELEREPPHLLVDIGSISIACALGYLDFRFAAEPWRPAHPHLAAWFQSFSENPGISRTLPQDSK